MTTRQATHFLFRGIQDKLGWDAPVRTRGPNIFWITERGGWHAMRHFSVTEYAPRLIRLRNDLDPQPFKSFWNIDQPPWYRFELTFHESEITPELGAMMHAFCEVLPLERQGAPSIAWPLFTESTTFPRYARTPAAQEYEHAHWDVVRGRWLKSPGGKPNRKSQNPVGASVP